MNHLDVIRRALPNRAFNAIVADSSACWVRADDLIVGVVFVSDGWRRELSVAYELLEGDSIDSPITKEEIWNLVLLVRVPNGRQDLAREIAQDLRYSRKVPYVDDETDNIPKLTGPFEASAGDSPQGADDPIADALQRVARPAERQLLFSVLLGADRRDRSEVEQLFSVLSEGDSDER